MVLSGDCFVWRPHRYGRSTAQRRYNRRPEKVWGARWQSALITAKRAFSCMFSLGSVSRRRNNATVGCLEVHKPDPRGKTKSKTRSPSRRLAAWILSPIGEQRRIN